MKNNLKVTMLLAAALTSFAVAEEKPPRSLQGLRVDAGSRPVVDGKLSDDCWQQAATATGFWTTDGLRQVERSARVQVAYDQEYLFIAFWAPLEEDGAPAKSRGVSRSVSGTPARVWIDRGFESEVFLSP